MIKIISLTEDLGNELLDSPGLEKVRNYIQPEHVRAVCAQKHSYAVVNAFGKVVAIGGVIEFWPGRGECWAVFAPDAGTYFFAIHKAVAKFFSEGHFIRIEALVRLDFPRGIKWMQMLGFTLEAPCLAQYREGQDYALYSLITKDTCDAKPL